MKIAYRDIESVVTQPVPGYGAVLLYGPDSGLAHERARRIKASVLAGNDDPFAFVELPAASLADDPARLSDEIMAIGLLSAKRLIWVRDATDKIAAILKEMTSSLHDSVFLVITAGELGPRSALRKWGEDEPGVAALPCYRDEVRDLQTVVRKSFSDAGIGASREVMDYLCAQLGNDREVTRSELEKIITYAGEEKTLTVDDVEALVDYNRDTSLDDIVNATADRDALTLDAMLSVHLREGTATVAYLRALQRYFNRLYFIKAKAEVGYDIETVIKGFKPRIHFKQEPLLIRHARNWSLEQITKALTFLISAEIASKSSDVPVAAATSRRLFQVAQIR